MVKTSLLAACIFIVSFLSAPIASGQSSASAQTKSYHCILSFHQGQQSARYSSGPVQTDVAQASLDDAWKSYIIATYHVTDPHAYGGCTIMTGVPANWDREVSSYEANSNRLGVQTTHVIWTSAPGQVAAASSAPPAPSALSHIATVTAPALSPTAAQARSFAQTPPPVPIGQDPRLQQIPSRIRGMMVAEANGSESSCRQDPTGYVRVDCRCFAQKILDYRIAHVNDYQVVYDPHDLVGHVAGWAQVPNVVQSAKQICTQ